MNFSELPLDHVGIAVHSLDEAVPLYRLITGAGDAPRERLTSQGVELVFIGSGNGRLELLQPVDDHSPIARFIERHGPGIHHLAYRVPDVAAALDRLVDSGLEPIDREPREGAEGHRVAFLHPRSTGRVLIELVGR